MPVLVITSSPSTKLDGSDVRNLREDQLSVHFCFIVLFSCFELYIIFQIIPIQKRQVPSIDKQLQEYSRTKALGEAAALASASDSLRICAIAPHQVYGPRDLLFLPSMVSAAVSGQVRDVAAV